jgi:hypothetical protein
MEASLEAALREVPEKLKKNINFNTLEQSFRFLIRKQNLPMIPSGKIELHPPQMHSRTYEDPE